MSTVPVFVSSTFRDFHGERDLLTGPICRALDERLAPYGHRVEMIDLRWGVVADETDDDEARQNAVLDVCLSEIDRSRPFFVGLVGNRFGWVPTAHRIAMAATEAGLSGDYSNWSVTALEFEHGAFARTHSTSMFFHRRLVGEPPAGWRDEDGTNIGSLVTRIRESGAQLFNYDAVADGTRIPDLRAFEQLVTRTLGDALEKHVRAQTRQTDPTSAAEQLFTERHTRAFAGRETEVQQLVDLLASGRSVVIGGDHGTGKSALWCAVVERLRHTHRIAAVPVIRAGGVTSALEVVLRLAQQLSIPSHDIPEDAPQWWRGVLASVGPVIIAVDGLDQLDALSRMGVSMVSGLPANVTVLTTTALTKHANALALNGAAKFKLAALPPDRVREMATVVAADMRRRLPEIAIAELARAPRLPSWLVFAIAEIAAINEESYRSVDPDKDPFAELNRVVSTTVANLPAEPEDIISRFAFRAERRYGTVAAEQFVKLLLTSRSGLTPLDIHRITGLDDLTVAGLRRAFAEVLATSPHDGRLAITDARGRAALSRFFGSGGAGALHERIAAYLRPAIEDPDDMIANCDLLWHAIHSTGPTRVSEFIRQYQPHEPQHWPYAMVLNESYQSGEPQLASLRGSGIPGLEFMIWAVTDVADMSRSAMRRMTEDIAHEAHQTALADPESAHCLSLALNTWGMTATLRQDSGDLAGALAMFDRGCEIGDRLRAMGATEVDPDEPDQKVALSVVSTLDTAAEAYLAAGRCGNAASLIEQAIKLVTPVYIEHGNRVSPYVTTTQVRFTESTIRGAYGNVWPAFKTAQFWLDQTLSDLAENPDEQDFHDLANDGLTVTGRLARLSGYLDEACGYFDRAIALAAQAVRTNPTDETAIACLAARHSDLARSRADRQRFADALTSQNEAVHLWAVACESAPDIVEYQRDRAIDNARLGEYLWRSGRSSEGAALLESSLRNLRALAASDPERAALHLHISYALRTLVRLRRSLQEGGAEVLVAEAADIAATLVARDSTNVDAQVAVVDCLHLESRDGEAYTRLRATLKQTRGFAPAFRLFLETPPPVFAAGSLDDLDHNAHLWLARASVDRANLEAIRMAGQAFTELAIAQSNAGELTVALATFDRVAQILFEVKTHHPKEREPRRDLAHAWINHFNAAVACGEVATAAGSMLEVTSYLDAEPALKDQARFELYDLAAQLRVTDPELSQRCSDAADKLRPRWWSRRKA